MPKVVTQRCLEQDLNLRPTDRKPKCLTVTPPRKCLYLLKVVSGIQDVDVSLSIVALSYVICVSNHAITGELELVGFKRPNCVTFVSSN